MKQGKPLTILFSNDIRKEWKGHEHIWINSSNTNDNWSGFGYRVNLLYNELSHDILQLICDIL